ncbi:hypothetical protein, conserved [Leishmania lindenbergi]|uniref:Uncharacterized protein n=1 Tax=Leishmania lindenbergi TaxID=651832 RepID=A0AAW3AXF0_9TRYP
MPFSNVSAEETRGLCEFAERRQLSRKTKTVVDGNTVHAESESVDGIDTSFLSAVVEVVEAVLMRYALTRVCDTATIPTGSTESVKFDQRGVAANGRAPFPSLFLHTPRAFVRLHGQQSDSLGSPSSPARRSVKGVRKIVCADGATALSNAYCTPGMPPTPLLFKSASVSTAAHSKMDERVAVNNMEDHRMQPAPLPYDSLARLPPQLHHNTSAVLHSPSLDSARPMVNLSLTPEPIGTTAAVVESDKSVPLSSSSVQEMVQVVLQGEAAVVVTTAVSLSGGAAAAISTPTSPQPVTMTETRCCSVAEEYALRHAAADTAALSEAPLLFSPDATSCVLVACRVTLHEGWQRLIASSVTTSLPVSAAAAIAVADASPQATCCVSCSRSFLSACGHTASAAMVHLDREDGVAEMLHQLVWDSAVPAFLHAVHQHYMEHMTTTSIPEAAGNSDNAASCAMAVMALKNMLRRLWRAAALPADPTSTPPPPLLQVDWYVVGAICMRKSAAPVLESVFQQFFPTSHATSTPPVTTPANLHLLAEEVYLNKLLPQLTSSATSTTSCSLNVAHRLREDGLCFWSFNTTFQPWCVEPDSRRRYAYPMTWGLLLSVATGHSWPATVQPGTRTYPLPEIRSLSAEKGYRWVTPLSSDVLRGTRRGPGDVERAGGLQLACNTVPSTTLAQRVNKSAASTPSPLRLWSSLNALSTSPSDAERNRDSVTQQDTTAKTAKLVTVTVTLASYVRTLLNRQEAWWARVQRCQTAPSEAGVLALQVPPSPSSTRKRVLPLLLRRHASLATPSPAQRHQQDSEGEDRENGDGDEDGGPLVHWSGVDAAMVRTLLSYPKESFLQWSTTPHCEPPDFYDHARDGLLWRASVRPADVFVEGTDGLYVE